MLAYLLDTNHLSQAIRRVSPLHDRMREVCRAGYRLGTCWPVLCELEAGISQSGDPNGFRRTLHSLLKEVRIWPTDWSTAHFYGDLLNKVKKKGRILSHVDLVLAAMAIHLNVTLLSADKDFEATPEIKIENWISP